MQPSEQGPIVPHCGRRAIPILDAQGKRKGNWGTGHPETRNSVSRLGRAAPLASAAQQHRVPSPRDGTRCRNTALTENGRGTGAQAIPKPETRYPTAPAPRDKKDSSCTRQSSPALAAFLPWGFSEMTPHEESVSRLTHRPRQTQTSSPQAYSTNVGCITLGLWIRYFGKSSILFSGWQVTGTCSGSFRLGGFA